jgi:hypothetical protein
MGLFIGFMFEIALSDPNDFILLVAQLIMQARLGATLTHVPHLRTAASLLKEEPRSISTFFWTF